MITVSIEATSVDQLLQEQSDLGLHSLSKTFKTFQQATKADNFDVIGALRVKRYLQEDPSQIQQIILYKNTGQTA